MSNSLLEYLKGQKCGEFKPLPFWNEVGKQLEWYWKDDPCYAESIHHDGIWVGSILKSQETHEVIGVEIFGVEKAIRVSKERHENRPQPERSTTMAEEHDQAVKDVQAALPKLKLLAEHPKLKAAGATAGFAWGNLVAPLLALFEAFLKELAAP